MGGSGLINLPVPVRSLIIPFTVESDSDVSLQTQYWWSFCLAGKISISECSAGK